MFLMLAFHFLRLDFVQSLEFSLFEGGKNGYREND